MNEIVKTFDDMQRAAQAFAASRYFSDAAEYEKAIVKILAGREMGFGAFASMTGIAVIQGKPVIGANLIAAAIKRTGKYNYRVIEHSETACKIQFTENGEVCGVSEFTMKDAQAAGLTGKDNWKKYPRNMLFARAISNGARWYCPDLFGGSAVYSPDELGANEDEDGNIIDVPVKPVVEVIAAKPVSPAVEITLEKAMLFSTPNGTLFGDLTIEQLEIVIERASTDDRRAAATLVRDYKRAEQTAAEDAAKE